jgi:hypothetical protein
MKHWRQRFYGHEEPRDSDHRVQNNSADRLRKARCGNDAGDDKPIDRMLQVLISSAIVKENNGT